MKAAAIRKLPAPLSKESKKVLGLLLKNPLFRLSFFVFMLRLAHKKELRARRLRTGVLLGFVAVFGVFVGYSFHLINNPLGHGTSVPGAANRPVLTRGNPTFSTVLPAGKDAKSLGGWARVSPPGRDPVYAYVDKIGTTRITVSQQPLPANFKKDPADSVGELATNFSATDKLNANGTIVYIGTSAKGPQSVILTKDNLLILIKSDDTIPDQGWTDYINSLQ